MRFIFLSLSLMLVAGPARAISPENLEAMPERLEKRQFDRFCTRNTARLTGALDRAWGAGRGGFVKACNANPAGPKLFPDATAARAKELAKRYCDFRPAVRFCMVCDLLITKKAANLKESFAGCRAQFAADEATEFARDVLGESATKKPRAKARPAGEGAGAAGDGAALPAN